ncbi:HdeD family acid-resistance protein [Candidatus Methylobacter favarea]|nr:HdeD family acid-resistance protein [Candidatus Methylobacter favarea]
MSNIDEINIELQHMQQQMLVYLRKHWKLFLTEGIIFIVLGISAIVIPQVFTVAIVLFLGWIILFGGIVHISRALFFWQMPGFWLWLFMGLLQLVIGFLFIANPIAGILTLTMLMALFFALEGITKISLALMMRPLTNWGFMLFSGITALVFALIIWLGWPETANWLLGLFLGINMVFLGWSLVKISLHHKESL